MRVVSWIQSRLERKKTSVSIMPESLETTMSEAELRDLIAYLATLRGARESGGR